MNRIGIFVFYEKKGIVEDYVVYLLKKMVPFFTRMICLSNGYLAKAEREKLSPFFDRIVIRENEGYDVTAFKEGYFLVRDELKNYDELVFFNGTFYGPVLPLDPMFETMEKEGVDFWGISRHKESRLRVVENTGLDYTPEHIQSYFIAVRKNMFSNECFNEYWKSMGEIVTYNDAVVNHELRFTQYFSEKGYKWSTYLKPSWMEQFHEYVMISHPVECISEYGCPFIKRRALLNSFFPRIFPYGQSRENDLIRYLRDNTDYPVEYIIHDLCRHEKAADIENALSRAVIVEDEKKEADDIFTIIYIDSPYYLDIFFEMAEKSRQSVVVCSEEFSDDVKKNRSGTETHYVNDNNIISVLLSVLHERSEKYVFFTSNRPFENSTADLLDDRYRAGVEEAYKSYKFFCKAGSIERFLDDNDDICAAVSGPTWWNALLAAEKRLGDSEIDHSAEITASYTFLAKRRSLIESLKAMPEATASDLCFIPAEIFIKEEKEIAAIYNSEQVDSGVRYLHSLQVQNVKDAHTIQRYDHARALADDFINTESFKERLWFLLLALSRRKRQTVGERLKDYLKKT